MPWSCLLTSGVSASSGSCCRMRETRSRTSLAAPSGSRSRENSIVMLERSSWLVDVSFWTPAMPDTASSIGWVTRRSMISAEAPR